MASLDLWNISARTNQLQNLQPPEHCATIKPSSRRTQRNGASGVKSPPIEPEKPVHGSAFTTALTMPEFQQPFLHDTEALIADLDSVRELILRIPIHNDTVLPDQHRHCNALGFAIATQVSAKTHAPRRKRQLRRVASIREARPV